MPVSTDGGAQVRWNPNGKELFYIATDDRLMAVPIRFVSNGKAVEPGAPLGLFATKVGSTAINTNRQQYAVSPDGQSFVMNSVLEGASTPPITVILNWKPKRLALHGAETPATRPASTPQAASANGRSGSNWRTLGSPLTTPFDLAISGGRRGHPRTGIEPLLRAKDRARPRAFSFRQSRIRGSVPRGSSTPASSQP
ncbi:MAG: hypothetical protein M3545_05520 [Acidobacteriota bacterium]|nr:hypothetical protein [Acidobacteriota bacterium]